MNNDDRIEKLEQEITEARINVSAIKAQLPYLATHADISRLVLWLVGLGLTSIISIAFGVLNYLK